LTIEDGKDTHKNSSHGSDKSDKFSDDDSKTQDETHQRDTSISTEQSEQERSDEISPKKNRAIIVSRTKKHKMRLTLIPKNTRRNEMESTSQEISTQDSILQAQERRLQFQEGWNSLMWGTRISVFCALMMWGLVMTETGSICLQNFNSRAICNLSLRDVVVTWLSDLLFGEISPKNSTVKNLFPFSEQLLGSFGFEKFFRGVVDLVGFILLGGISLKIPYVGLYLFFCLLVRKLFWSMWRLFLYSVPLFLAQLVFAWPLMTQTYSTLSTGKRLWKMGCFYGKKFQRIFMIL
jgi:hypothetical protein